MAENGEATALVPAPKSYKRVVRPWTAAQYEYAWWLAMPTRARQPRTKEQLAAKMGMSRNTFTKWDKKPGFSDLIREQAMKMVGRDWPQVLHSMIREARAGNVEAAKFVGRILGLYSEKREVSGDPNRPFIFRIVPGTQRPGDLVVEPPVVDGEIIGSDS